MHDNAPTEAQGSDDTGAPTPKRARPTPSPYAQYHGMRTPGGGSSPLPRATVDMGETEAAARQSAFGDTVCSLCHLDLDDGNTRDLLEMDSCGCALPRSCKNSLQ